MIKVYNKTVILLLTAAFVMLITNNAFSMMTEPPRVLSPYDEPPLVSSGWVDCEREPLDYTANAPYFACQIVCKLNKINCDIQVAQDQFSSSFDIDLWVIYEAWRCRDKYDTCMDTDCSKLYVAPKCKTQQIIPASDQTPYGPK
jgi:hypothetical protein